MSETVLVTGGSGFVASWCIAELLQRGYAVRTTVRSGAKEAAVREAVGSIPTDGRLTFAIADLTKDAGWDAALAGCDYVLHVASPLSGAPTSDRDAFVAPARDGTLRVLRAATNAGVKRVVMTSAAAAARLPLAANRVSDETIWADPDDPQFDAYRRSKILAERAAWDFIAANGGTTQLTTILPGAVFGPVLARENLGSVQIISRMLEGRPPAIPRLGFWVVDVRDLADLHIRAMTSSDASGQRFLAAGEFLWMEEIARILRAKLGARASKVPTRRLPDALFRFVAIFLPQLKALAPLIGQRYELSSVKASRVLGFAPRAADATVYDCALTLGLS
jgi:nucleoside-diphosphate-sugar epimerase